MKWNLQLCCLALSVQCPIMLTIIITSHRPILGQGKYSISGMILDKVEAFYP